jgi:hypothetical protein
MNGLVISSLSSGILLFSEEYKENFGLDNAGRDAMQLSSSLFALYKNSQTVHSKSLTYIKQVRFNL